MDDSVFVATLDAHLVALNASTGARKWEVEVADFRDNYSMTGAPLALGDVIVVGDVEGYLHFLSRDSGSFVGRATTDGNPIRTSLLRLEQGFLVQNQAGNLYAVTLR